MTASAYLPVVVTPLPSPPPRDPYVTVVVRPNPFKPSIFSTFKAPPGETIEELVVEALDLSGSPLAKRWVDHYEVEAQGRIVAPELWARTRPKAGTLITVHVAAPGALGAILATIWGFVKAAAIWLVETLVIEGIAFAAFNAGIPYALAYGIGVVAGIAYYGAIAYSLYASIRSLTANQSAGRLGGLQASGGGAGSSSSGGGRAASDSPTISGQGNSLNPWQPFWRIFGKHRVRPPIVGKPYTEINGGVMYLRMLLCLGYGPVEVSDVRIGRTPIDDFQGTSYVVVEGWAGSKVPSLYPGKVVTEALNIRLHANNGGSTGPDKVRVTALDTSEVAFEIVFPGGFVVYNEVNEKIDVPMKFLVRYRKVGTEPWIEPRSGDDREQFQIESGKGKTKQKGPGEFEVWAPSEGRFFVGGRFCPGRMNGETAPDEYEINLLVQGRVGNRGGPFQTECFWQALHQFGEGPAVTVPGMAYLALRIKATNQLAGAIETLNCVVESFLRTWDPFFGWSGSPSPPPLVERNAGWYIQAGDYPVGRSPAWAVLEVLTGHAQRRKLADGQIDLTQFYLWAEELKSMGAAEMTPYRNFDGVVDFGGNGYSLINDIMAVGRGSVHMRDTKLSVVWDRNTALETPVDEITPRSVISRSFQGTKSFEELPQLVRRRFVSEALDWEFDEIEVLQDGIDPEDVVDISETEAWGLTDGEHNWVEERLTMARAKLRPEVYVVQQDWERLRVERGDLVLLSHDVPLLGLAWGIVKEHSVTGLTLDETLTFEPGKAYGISIRNAAPPFFTTTLNVVNIAGAEIVKSKELVYETPLIFDLVAAGSIVAFGERGLETRRVIVKSIEMKPELGAIISLVDEAVGVWDAISGPIPPYDPGITPPVDATPGIPVVLGIEPGSAGVTLTIQPASGGFVPTRFFEVWFRLTNPEGGSDSGWARLQLFEVNGVEEIDVGPLVTDHFYDFRVRALGGPLNAASAWNEEIADYYYAGPEIFANAFRVSKLQLEMTGRDVRARWELNSIVFSPDDILHPTPAELVNVHPEDAANPYFKDYEIRYVDPATGAVVRTDHSRDRDHTYEERTQIADRVTLRRMRVGVAFRDRRNNIGPFTWGEVENPPVILSRVSIGTSGGTLAATVETSAIDVRSFRLWAGLQSTYPDPLDMPLDATTLRAESTATPVVWADAPRGDFWVFVAGVDAFGPDLLVPAGPFGVSIAGPGIGRDILISQRAISAATTNTVTLTGGPFSITEEELLRKDAKVSIRLPEGALVTDAAGQSRRISAFNPATGVITIDRDWAEIPVPGVDQAEVWAADIEDGVVDELTVIDFYVDTIHLRKGSVTTAAYRERRDFSEKPRRERYRTLVAASADIVGEERVILDGEVEVIDTTPEISLNQIIFLRELQRGIVAGTGYIQWHACDALGGGAGSMSGELFVASDHTEGTGSLSVICNPIGAIILISFLLEDPPDVPTGIHAAETVLRFDVRALPASGSLIRASVFIHQDGGFGGAWKRFDFFYVPSFWSTDVTIDLSGVPDAYSGTWDGNDIAFLRIEMLWSESNHHQLWVDDVRFQGGGNSDTRIVCADSPIFTPGAYVSGNPLADPPEPLYVVCLRPLMESAPEVWDEGGTEEKDPTTTAHELFRTVIGNDIVSLQVGNPPVNNKVMPNANFHNGNPQVGDAWILFKLVRAVSRSSAEEDRISLRASDLDPGGSGNPEEPKPTEYRMAVRRRKPEGTGQIDQSFDFSSLEVTKVKR